MEFVFAAVFKLDTGARDKVDNGSRHKHLTGLGNRLDSCGENHGDAGCVVAAAFDFSCVQP